MASSKGPILLFGAGLAALLAFSLKGKASGGGSGDGGGGGGGGYVPPPPPGVPPGSDAGERALGDLFDIARECGFTEAEIAQLRAQYDQQRIALGSEDAALDLIAGTINDLCEPDQQTIELIEKKSAELDQKQAQLDEVLGTIGELQRDIAALAAEAQRIEPAANAGDPGAIDAQRRMAGEMQAMYGEMNRLAGVAEGIRSDIERLHREIADLSERADAEQNEKRRGSVVIASPIG